VLRACAGSRVKLPSSLQPVSRWLSPESDANKFTSAFIVLVAVCVRTHRFGPVQVKSETVTERAEKIERNPSGLGNILLLIHIGSCCCALVVVVVVGGGGCGAIVCWQLLDHTVIVVGVVVVDRQMTASSSGQHAAGSMIRSKETLRKCTSDPVSASTNAVSKCLLTLDGYNYIIGISSNSSHSFLLIFSCCS